MEALKAKNCTAIRTEIGWSLSEALERERVEQRRE